MLPLEFAAAENQQLSRSPMPFALLSAVSNQAQLSGTLNPKPYTLHPKP